MCGIFYAVEGYHPQFPKGPSTSIYVLKIVHIFFQLNYTRLRCGNLVHCQEIYDISNVSKRCIKVFLVTYKTSEYIYIINFWTKKIITIVLIER